VDTVIYDYVNSAIEVGILCTTIEAEFLVKRDSLYDFAPTTASTARLWIDNDLTLSSQNNRLQVTASLAQAASKRESRFHSKLIGHSNSGCFLAAVPLLVSILLTHL
jgi:hypothetical protein